MASDRIQRTINGLLDEAEQAVSRSDWSVVQDRARNVLAFDPDNEDAQALIAMADADGESEHAPPSSAPIDPCGVPLLIRALG